MTTTPIEAVYKDGVLRPTHPIDLAEGTRVEILVFSQGVAPPLGPPTPAEVAARIAAMPLQSSPKGLFLGEDHDAVLYGPEGDTPR